MSTIDKMRQEIERLKAKYRKDMYKSNHEGLASGYKIEAYNELLPFLSTLESEKPTQEGLEEEIREYLSNEDNNPLDWDWMDKRDCACHFAEWGYLRAAEKYDEIEYNRQRAEESVQNDLEEAAEEYFQKIQAEFLRTLEHPTAKDCFIAGAKWQKEQFQELIWMLMRPIGGWGEDKDKEK